jgi:hypothetical protein
MAGKNSFTDMSESLLNNSGQGNYKSTPNSNNRIIFPAVVRESGTDNAGMNRIRAEIVALDSSGNIIPGRDKNYPTAKLPICIPLLPEFFHGRVSVGEMVIIISENPSDLSSVRYYIGPLISSQLNLSYQSYESSSDVFSLSNYAQQNTTAPSTKDKKNASSYAQQSDISIQGRRDSDIIFRPRYAILRAGTFNTDNSTLNTTTPCTIEIKQVDTQPAQQNSIKIFNSLSSSSWKPYSQTNIQSTNINIYSPEGKFVTPNNNSPEISDRLKDFGNLSLSLHPSVFGDELLILLNLILKFLITHIHTPQSVAVETKLLAQLQNYLSGNKLQDLISNVVRIN